MRKIFLTFADAKMSRSLIRIQNQALAMNVYDCVIAANENNLDLDFREAYKEYLISSVRGFGYWIWKAQLIIQTLRQMKEGDILQYTDAGCHLNLKGRDRLNEYFELVKKSRTGILGFQAIKPSFHNPKITLPDQSDYKWCKGDLINALGVGDKSHIINSQAIGAGIIFIKKNAESESIIKKWFDVYKKNISLIDDSTSVSPNINGFVEHRHDQAIFSLLGKIYGIDTISAYEYWYPSARFSMLPDWGVLEKYPILAKRDKGVHWTRKPYALIIRIYKRIHLEIRKRIL